MVDFNLSLKQPVIAWYFNQLGVKYFVTMSDELIEISSSEWTTLRDMYLRDWPMHIVGYYTLDNYVRWNQIQSTIKQLHIYLLNGDWQQDGTFVVVVNE